MQLAIGRVGSRLLRVRDGVARPLQREVRRGAVGEEDVVRRVRLSGPPALGWSFFLQGG